MRSFTRTSVIAASFVVMTGFGTTLAFASHDGGGSWWGGGGDYRDGDVRLR